MLCSTITFILQEELRKTTVKNYGKIEKIKKENKSLQAENRYQINAKEKLFTRIQHQLKMLRRLEVMAIPISFVFLHGAYHVWRFLPP